MEEVAAGVPLAQQASGASSGWVIGFIIGAVVILVVVIIVATILNLASKISDQAQDAIHALDSGESNTDALWGIQTTNRVAGAIYAGAQKARKAVQG